MSITKVQDKQSGRHEGLCPRCGSDAEWSFRDEEETVVEVVCADCGRFELSRAEFDQAESDISGPGPRE
jgi:hypothetical protein